MLTESDKVIITKYPILPSTCVICLRSANGELNFIDFQMSLDLYGSVNICTECMAPVAELLGFVEKGLLQDAQEEVEELTERIKQLEDKNVELSSTLDSLVKFRPDFVERDLASDEDKSEGFTEPSLDIELDLGFTGTDH